MRYLFYTIALFVVTSCRAEDLVPGAVSRLPPPDAQVSLQTDHKQFYLGENVIVHFCVENIGAQPFTISTGGDYRGAARHMRFKVEAHDSSGALVPDPYPNMSSFGGLGGSRVLKSGQKWFQTLSLIPYCRFNAPDEYSVRVQHDFGWQATPDHPLPVAEIKLRLVMPTAEQARKIVAKTAATPENPGVLQGEKNTFPWRDFSAMRLPVYLPALLEHIQNGKLEFLASVGGIETPEATQALIEMLKSTPATALAAAEVLARRVPLASEVEWRNAHAALALALRRDLVEKSWRPNFAAPVRAYTIRAVGSNDRRTLRNAAWLLQNIGIARDLPPVLSALNRRIAATVKAPRWKTDGDSFNDGDGWQLQDDCLSLIRCGRALINRGGALCKEAAAPVGSIALRIAAASGERFAIAGGQSWSTPSWQKTSAKWLRHPTPFIRQLTLESLTPPRYPPPVPRAVLTSEVRALLPKLITDSDPSVRAAACVLAGLSRDTSLLPSVLRVVATASNMWVIDAANNAAGALGGRYPMWLIWARRLDEKGMLRFAIVALSEVVAGRGGYSWDSNVKQDVGRVLKPRWQKFLRENRARLLAGKLFTWGEPALPVDLFPPQFQISRAAK